MDRFENMRTFIRVVEAGSISGAADRMDIAKSAVSRRLKELEAHLGVELFHRTTRRMNLTDTGQAFYQRCVRILDDVLEAEHAVSEAHGMLEGRLKVALPSSFGAMHMGPAINDFMALHPNIEFDLDFNDRQIDLMQEGFDLGIRIADLPDSSLIAKRLTTISHVFCASPDYLEKHGMPASPEDISQHQCLAYSLADDSKSWPFLDAKRQVRRVGFKPHLVASQGEYLRDAAVDGHGLIFMPTFIPYQEIERGELITLFNELPRWELNAYAIYPQTRHLSQRVRVFVDFLVKRFEGVPYWEECLESTGPKQ